MRLYVNGLQTGAYTTAAFTRADISNDIYVGDFDPDYWVPNRVAGFVGMIDNLQTSGVADDQHLISPGAVPEPGTLLVLLSGLVPTALALRKRRS